jgi:hypothetical protein
MKLLEYIWDWETFIKPDTEFDISLHGPTDRLAYELEQKWLENLAKCGMKSPKYVLAFTGTQEEKNEIMIWLKNNISNGYYTANSIIVDNDKDMLHIKMVWG